MPKRRVSARCLAVTGVSGVVVAHAVDYGAVFPHSQQRDIYLADTGHAYWPLAIIAATLFGVAALVGVVRRGWRDGARHRSGGAARLGLQLAALGVWQVVLFAGLEAAERATVGVNPLVLFHSPEFWLGLLLQVVVAGAAVMVLHGTGGIAYCVAAARRRRIQRQRSAVACPIDVGSPPSVAHRAWRSRAPPPALV